MRRGWEKRSLLPELMEGLTARIKQGGATGGFPVLVWPENVRCGGGLEGECEMKEMERREAEVSPVAGLWRGRFFPAKRDRGREGKHEGR
ncbi:hypothetical protein HAX54_047195 [Datura stramonium]|uniref:Uncharacterized protein n=1 Tax=Datura stramonium TaxID=4076 RepID=A0ABS8WJY6_DATST|nr:hypothetical protein [Datura stramonium]